MRVEFREVEFSGNHKDQGADGPEPAIAAALAFDGLKQPVQGLQMSILTKSVAPGACYVNSAPRILVTEGASFIGSACRR